MPKKYSDADRQELSQKLAQIKADGYSKPDELVSYAQQLVGHTFQDVLDLKLSDIPVSDSYGNNKRKGGLSNLLEEQYFAYPANSDSLPDFAKAGMEFKATPVLYKQNRKKQATIRAKERLVLTMIPNTEPIEADYDKSSLKGKSSDILLVHYLADSELPKLDQEIIMANRWLLPEADLEIIRNDYRTIAEMVQAGRAHELSESMTKYLAACTKGASASKSLQDQYYPLIHEDGRKEYVKAKRRAFSFKLSYMTAVAQKFEQQKSEEDALIQDSSILQKQTFEEYVSELLVPYYGRTESSLFQEFGQPSSKYPKGLTKNAKNARAALVARMLGSKTDNIAEFKKANIQVKTIKLEQDGKQREHTKLREVNFSKLHAETDWEESDWYTYLQETRILFIVFQKNIAGELVLKGNFFWSAPVKDIGSEDSENINETAYGYWLDTKKVLREGVRLENKNDKITNNFINAMDHPFCHIRPSSTLAAYQFTDGRPSRGNVKVHAQRLPDGQYMTKQAFWLSKEYAKNLLIKEGFLPGA